MTKPTALAATAALTLALSAGAALADGNSAFGAANTALLMGNTASPGRLYVPTESDEERLVTGSVTGSITAPAAAPAPHGPKAPARAPIR